MGVALRRPGPSMFGTLAPVAAPSNVNVDVKVGLCSFLIHISHTHTHIYTVYHIHCNPLLYHGYNIAMANLHFYERTISHHYVKLIS